ncbi:MAG: ferric reductase-like transmembrane domain-containing protein [Planctomycetota bacterium]
MSLTYRAVNWNPHKKRYDLILTIGVLAYIVGFVVLGTALAPPDRAVSPPILIMRAAGTCAIVLLHVILLIGPLARLDTRFAPLLYNRRHLGVTFFLVCFVHAFVAIGFYGAFGPRNPVLAVVGGYDGAFELLGFAALAIFFLMAATSHDFWLANLSPRWWKALHMLVYVAYALVIAHVALGALQSETHPIFAALLGFGIVLVTLAHLAAGLSSWGRDAANARTPLESGWIDAGSAIDIQDTRAVTVRLPSGKGVAIYRDGDSICAISSVCAHQGGPLGEGKIIDGCVTCPWHGYQYRADNGQSPPPYEEKLATYNLRIEGERIMLDPTPNEPGTPTTPVTMTGGGA